MGAVKRTCTICGKQKPESEFKVRKGKYVNQCKTCINEAAKVDRQRAAAMERARGRSKRWVDNNPEAYKAQIAKNSERRRQKRDK